MVETQDMQLVAQLDKLVAARGIRHPVWREAIGVAPSTWYRWRSGAARIPPTPRALLRMVVSKPELIFELLELAAEGDGDEQ